MSDFKLFDGMRMLLGDVPWSFLAEGVIRVSFIYALLVGSMRLMGKRMGQQLSRNEMAAMVSLAAAGGVAVLAPDRGLLPPLVVASILVVGQRLIARATMRNSRFEQLSQGDIGIMVADGCLQFNDMAEAVLSPERVFAKLRSQGITNLGQVKRLYMEANGSFTLVEQNPPQPGLTLAPDWDQDYIRQQPHVPGTFACTKCGHLTHADQLPATTCPRCQNRKWSPAVITQTATQ
ncbi:DUF421 domain-containing protein [Hymenobacter norwichensis]|uniref:DUF421 domain-containing protein n=1 Tax=Hymenobacter norwichensis TaxID=223903 RepID=UPI0003B513F8|nr:YetF domain-containing protein [Hymenobacter norwichensis]